MERIDRTKPFVALDVIGWLDETKHAVLDDITFYANSWWMRDSYWKVGEVFTIKGKSLNYYIRDFTGEIDEKRAKRIATEHHAGNTVRYRLD